MNDITFPADNEALDVQKPSENVKAVVNPTDYGKRYSSGDIPKYRRLPNQPGSSVHSFNASGRLSISLNSISSATSTEYAESQMVDQEDIVNLTAHVRNFSDALSKLRSAFSGSGSDTESDGKSCCCFFIIPIVARSLCKRKLFLRDLRDLCRDVCAGVV